MPNKFDKIDLKKARNMLGYPQHMMADALGISHPAYRGWETGNRGSPGRRAKMAAAFLLQQNGYDWCRALPDDEQQPEDDSLL